MIIKSITVSMFATNCYLVACPTTKDAVIIDPGAEGKSIIARVRALDLNVKMIVNTHGHIDHIGANHYVKEQTGAPVLLHRQDLALYHNPGFGLNLVTKKQPEPDRFIADGDLLHFGDFRLQALETPGHSAGSISLLGEGVVFCGDTLFAGSIGRTDLAGGSYSQIISSIKERLLNLPGNTIVYPGHGPQTTIGDEKMHNPYL